MAAPTDLPLQLRREGGAIRYRVQGSSRDAAQPLLVLVHGWCCDAGYWDAQLADLAVDHRVVTLDLAGHGRSADASTDGRMASFGADVAALGALTAPVVALNAAVTRTDGARLRGIAPGFRLRESEGVGHFLMMEQPARFNALLREELAALAAG